MSARAKPVTLALKVIVKVVAEVEVDVPLFVKTLLVIVTVGPTVLISTESAVEAVLVVVPLVWVTVTE